VRAQRGRPFARLPWLVPDEVAKQREEVRRALDLVDDDEPPQIIQGELWLLEPRHVMGSLRLEGVGRP